MKEGLMQYAEENALVKKSENGAWKILVVDDEQEVHAMTRIILRDFTFEDRNIEQLSAYSGEEAKKILSDHPDIALILLDVVMETEDAGLRLAKYIREVQKNKLIRIVLRTGQPGQAPEKKVISDYDINDYKEKTELTTQKLYTAIISGLRSYRDLKVIDQNKRGLEKIIDSSKNLFRAQSLKQFASGVLIQIASILSMDDGFLFSSVSGFALTNESNKFNFIAGAGKYENLVSQPAEEVLPEDVINKLKTVIENKKTMFFDNEYIGYFPNSYGFANILYLKGKHIFKNIDKNLLTVFSSNISVAFENIYLMKKDKEKAELLRQAQKMDMVGTLAGGIAHDFNNSLTAILGTVGLLNFLIDFDDQEKKKEIMEYLDIIEIAGHHAAEIVKQLLVLARSSGKQNEPIDLIFSIKHLKKICSSSFDKNINVITHSEIDSAYIKGDSTQIEQMLLNICINASHAMTIMQEEKSKIGGNLTITLKDKIFIPNANDFNVDAKPGEFWVIEIQDDGIGMSEDTISRIFNPFYTTKKEDNGSGLGLAMVYNIIINHQGFIKVESELDKGSKFSVYLPFYKEKIKYNLSEDNKNCIPNGSGIILLVEDEYLIRLMTKDILQRCGYEVFSAADGHRAIDIYKNFKDEIDLVIIDISMPGISGKETYKKLLELNEDIKVIFTTTHESKPVFPAELQKGIVDILLKPYNITEIANACSKGIE